MEVKEKAPEFIVSEWLNSQHDISIASLKGKVIVLHAFQMLCPGCVSHGIPQAIKMFQMFDPEKVAVLGIHTVFEHHEVMNSNALKAFIHEYRLLFPIGIDKRLANERLPETMKRYRMQGTPSLIIIDKEGYVRMNLFGRGDDLHIGSLIGQLAAEQVMTCTDTVCKIS